MVDPVNWCRISSINHILGGDALFFPKPSRTALKTSWNQRPPQVNWCWVGRDSWLPDLKNISFTIYSIGMSLERIWITRTFIFWLGKIQNLIFSAIWNNLLHWYIFQTVLGERTFLRKMASFSWEYIQPKSGTITFLYEGRGVQSTRISRPAVGKFAQNLSKKLALVYSHFFQDHILITKKIIFERMPQFCAFWLKSSRGHHISRDIWCN